MPSAGATAGSSAIPRPEPWSPSVAQTDAPTREPVTLAERVGGPAAPDDVVERLRDVIDPELGVDIVSLGLVYDAEVVDGVARILMTTTTPACPLGAYLSDAVRRALLDLGHVTRVEVEVTHQPRWSPALMNDDAKAQLGWNR